MAEALRPTNLAARPRRSPTSRTPPPRSARPAVARTLPDRFFVRIEQDGAAPVTVHGDAIPDELPVGLTDRDEFTALQIDGEDLPPIDESLRWLVDYAEAERLGMAVTVPLPLPGRPVRRLLVYGVRAALDRPPAPRGSNGCIRSHRFTDGAEFVAQGTPTNNTESARTDWSRRTPPGPPVLDARPPRSMPAPMPRSPRARSGSTRRCSRTLPGGARRRAGARGRVQHRAVDDDLGRRDRAPHAGGPRQRRPAAGQPVARRGARPLDRHVRGRGPLPALRLGRQPYGLLPVVETDAS